LVGVYPVLWIWFTVDLIWEFSYTFSPTQQPANVVSSEASLAEAALPAPSPAVVCRKRRLDLFQAMSSASWSLPGETGLNEGIADSAFVPIDFLIEKGVAIGPIDHNLRLVPIDCYDLFARNNAFDLSASLHLNFSTADVQDRRIMDNPSAQPEAHDEPDHWPTPHEPSLVE
jgi:hypothetical protein